MNVVLAKLWFGCYKPDWNVFFDYIRETIDTTPTLMFNDTVWTVRFQIKLLVADLPAKAAILNMQQFFAYFGGTLCLIECQLIGKRSRGLFYPNQRHQMRSKENQEKYLRL